MIILLLLTGVNRSTLLFLLILNLQLILIATVGSLALASRTLRTTTHHVDSATFCSSSDGSEHLPLFTVISSRIQPTRRTDAKATSRHSLRFFRKITLLLRRILHLTSSKHLQRVPLRLFTHSSRLPWIPQVASLALRRVDTLRARLHRGLRVLVLRGG